MEKPLRLEFSTGLKLKAIRPGLSDTGPKLIILYSSNIVPLKTTIAWVSSLIFFGVIFLENSALLRNSFSVEIGSLIYSS